MKFLVILSSILVYVSTVHSGGADLPFEEAKRVLELWHSQCLQGHGPTYKNIYCEESNIDLFPEEPKKRVIRLPPPETNHIRKQVIFIEPPTTLFKHNINLINPHQQYQPTKIYVLPPKHSHDFQIEDLRNFGAPPKPVVHFIRKPDAAVTSENHESFDRFHPVYGKIDYRRGSRSNKNLHGAPVDFRPSTPFIEPPRLKNSVYFKRHLKFSSKESENDKSIEEKIEKNEPTTSVRPDTRGQVNSDDLKISSSKEKPVIMESVESNEVLTDSEDPQLPASTEISVQKITQKTTTKPVGSTEKYTTTPKPSKYSYKISSNAKTTEKPKPTTQSFSEALREEYGLNTEHQQVSYSHHVPVRRLKPNRFEFFPANYVSYRLSVLPKKNV